MPDDAVPTAARGSVPAGYQEAFRWNISQLGGRIALVQVLAGILFFLALGFYLLLAAGLGRFDFARGLAAITEISESPYRMGEEIGRDLEKNPSGAVVRMILQGLGGIFLIVGGVLGAQMVIVLFHEVTHGAAMRLFGAHPVFGFIPKGLMFYATSPGYAYPRIQYFWVGMAPLIFLDLFFLLLLLLPIGMAGAAIVAALAALNTGGAAGDLWILAILRKYSSRAYIMDEKDGMRIFIPAEEAAKV